MAILNYTTKIAAEKTVSEIQANLVKAGAQAVLCEYEGGVITHLSFRMNTPHGEMSFRLPANIEGVFNTLQRDKRVPKSDKTREQAARVTWRILKDWCLAQCAIVEAEMATLPQVFLPYAQTKMGGGMTLYDLIEHRGMDNLLSGPKQQDD